MSWDSSDRRSRLPANWSSLRRKRLSMDHYMCQWVLPDGTLCLDSATEVDHIIAGDNHALTNLQSLCYMHHSRKSSSEGGAARAANRRRISQSFRRAEKHPGSM